MYSHPTAAGVVSLVLALPATLSADMFLGPQPWNLNPTTASAAWSAQSPTGSPCDMTYDQHDSHGYYDDASLTNDPYGTIQGRTYYIPYIVDGEAYLNFETYYDTVNVPQDQEPSILWEYSGSFQMPEDQDTFYIGVSADIDYRGTNEIEIIPSANGTTQQTATFRSTDPPNPDTKILTLDNVAGDTVTFSVYMRIYGFTTGESQNEPHIINTYIGYGGDSSPNAVPGPAGAATLLCSGLLTLRRRRRN